MFLKRRREWFNMKRKKLFAKITNIGGVEEVLVRRVQEYKLLREQKYKFVRELKKRGKTMASGVMEMDEDDGGNPKG